LKPSGDERVVLFLRPNDLGPEDFTVICKHEGRDREVGRVFRTNAARADAAPIWVWTVEFHQRMERAEPHQGHELTLEGAQAASNAAGSRQTYRRDEPVAPA
jgi:hypothetical protein